MVKRGALRQFRATTRGRRMLSMINAVRKRRWREKMIKTFRKLRLDFYDQAVSMFVRELSPGTEYCLKVIHDQEAGRPLRIHRVSDWAEVDYIMPAKRLVRDLIQCSSNLPQETKLQIFAAASSRLFGFILVLYVYALL
ncbi:hypothetical protein F0562_023670 [Nyssa sinensis]|uniref:Uncharacterized protein n=1 Tax=Nyssa sinensis TaxID=561372 RepID=A0A5J5BIR1_9ASTE|nr:hypothetical protein F0562_023670 [Nyssa sinensis]